MNSEMWRISERLTDPTLTDEELAECYSGLSRISEDIRQQDMQRRTIVVRFSNGVEMSHATIAGVIHKTSVADFCIRYGLTRAEVLARTVLAKVGAS